MRTFIYATCLMLYCHGFLHSQTIPPLEPNRIIEGTKEGAWVIWFNKDWQITQIEDSVSFYRKVTYKNGVPDGKVIDYYINGNMQWEGYLISEDPDVYEGLNIWYFENGNKSQECVFENERIEGEFKKYYESGKIKALDNYSVGLFNGPSYEFYENGLISVSTFFEYGLETGPRVLFFPDGTIEKKSDITHTWNELFQHASILYEIGYVLESKFYCEQALGLHKEQISSSDEDYYDILKLLMHINLELKYYDKSISIANELLWIIEKKTSKLNSNYIDVLIDLALAHRELNHVEKALNVLNIAKELTENTNGVKTVLYADILISMGFLYYSTSNYEKAISFYVEALEIIKNSLGKNHPDYEANLSFLAFIYFELGKYDLAHPLYEEALEILENTVGKNDLNYEVILNLLTLLYTDMGQFVKAIPLYQEAIEITEKKTGKNHPDFGVKVNNLAKLYSDVGQYENALPLYLEAIEIAEKTVGKENPTYTGRLNNLASLYSKMGNFEKAFSLSLEAMEIAEKFFDKSHHNYWQSINNLATNYSQMGQYETALSLSMKAIEITEKSHGKCHPNYSVSLNNLALLYSEMGQHEKALSLNLEAVEITEKLYGKNHPSFAISIHNLSNIYSQMGQYETALSLGLEALEITEKSLGKNHPSFSVSIKNLADVYSEMGQIEKAYSLTIEALEIQEKTLGKSHPVYAVSLNNLAFLYSEMGQYEKALNLFSEALEITEQSLGKSHPIYGLRLSNIAQVFKRMGQTEKAYLLTIEALEIQEKTLGKNHPDYAVSLNNLAMLNLEMGHFINALSFINMVIEIAVNSVGKNHPEHATWLNNLATIYSEMGDYKKALSIFIEANEIAENTFRKNHLKTGVLLNNLASLYQINSQHEEAYSTLLKSIQNIKFSINQNFSFLSENQKNNFLKSITHNFDVYRSFLIDYYMFQSLGAQDIYDLELILKSMVLNSVIQMRKTVELSKDPELIQKFEEWRQLRFLLARQYSLPIDQRRLDIDSLIDMANSLEGQINRMSSSVNKSLAVQKSKWNDVRSALREGEVAIEFSHFQYKNPKNWTDSIMYVALVLRPQDSIPVMIRLFEQKQIDSIFVRRNQSESRHINGIYKNTRLYELLWKPIEPYLQKDDKVFFSPSGILNQVSFSAIQKNDSTYISEEYELNQLSSTGLLTVRQDSPEETIHRIAIFGGINYDASDDAIAPVLASISSTGDYVSRSLYLQDSTRSGKWTYLPGTLDEAENISKIAHEDNIEVDLFIGDHALEEQFKKLDGENSPSVLHIATHGFFFPDPKVSYKRNDFFSFHEMNQFTLADDPLNRSGLLFAGCNNAWTGDSIIISREDGILTAYEASHINLHNTNLVVLSACETGLGDIKGSEGVYGLQRAFKQTGAKYLMMSLWKVPDEETKEFMINFYTEYIGNEKNVRNAFMITQQKMREKYRDFPNKWAGFILLE